jgi:organic radical activating enzyme
MSFFHQVSAIFRFFRQIGLKRAVTKTWRIFGRFLWHCFLGFWYDLRYHRGFSALRNLVCELKYLYTDLVFLSYRLPIRRVSDMPLYSLVEVTSFCNIKCQICPRQAYYSRKDGNMEFKLYRKIIDQLTDPGPLLRLTLHFSGEPLVHPGIGEMIRYAKQRGVFWIKFNSNATLLNEKRGRELLGSGIDCIYFAIEINREYHERYRQGSEYDDVVQRVKEFMRLKRQLRSTTPCVKVIMLVSREMDPRLIEKARDYWLPIVDRVELASISTGGGEIEDLGTLNEPNRLCWEVYLALHFLWDGRAVPCCVDHNGDLVCGDVTRQSVREIFHSPFMKRLRDADAACDYSHHPKCQKCMTSKG